MTLPGSLGGVDFDLPPAESPGGLRTQLNALTDVLDQHGTGLLITLDEVHAKAARDEIAHLCAVIQHGFREERPIAFAAAGLPAAVQDLLTSDVSTFLRRARRFVLEPLSPVAAEEALRVPIGRTSRTIDAADLAAAASGTFGYPFLIQLVGDQMWRQDPDSSTITAAHVAAGLTAARREIGASVHEPALNDLSETDREFVKAMATDSGMTAVADIETRMSRDHGYVSRYRSRLIVAGIVEAPRRGYLDFTIPYMRDFVRENLDRL